EVALERLEPTDISAYLAAEFPGSDFPPALARLVFQHSGGNSLFMAAIVQDMAKKGVIASQGKRWTVTVPLEDFAPGVPETLQQLLEVQLDRLNPFEQRTLRNASVIGERFSLSTLTSMLEADLDQVENVCEALARRQQFIRYTGMQEFADAKPVAQY